MYLVSTICMSRANEDVPITIACFGDQKKFVKRAGSYEEMEQLVRTAFGLDPREKVSFSTASFSVCKGDKIEIDESAYPLMCTFVDEIIVTSRSKEQEECLSRLEQSTVDNAKEFESKNSPIIPVYNSQPLTHAGTEAFQGNQADPEETFNDLPHQLHAKSQKQLSRSIQRNPMKLTANNSAKSSPACRTVFAPRQNFPDEENSDQVTKPKAIIEPEQITTIGLTSSQESVEDNSRVLLTISGPLPEHIAEFKTRGKHQVKKILSAACKAFDIDYHQSRLFLVEEETNDSGETYTHESECLPEDTVAENSIRNNSKLIIRLRD